MAETGSEKILHRLETHGWQKGGNGGSEGPNCLMGAMLYTIGRSVYYQRLRDALPGGYSNVASFNDDPNTTYEDVVLLLKRAAELEREAELNHG